LFFISNGQLWKSDGDLCNTVLMTFADGVSYLDWLPYLVTLEGKLFFEAVTKETGGELFYYDYSTGGPLGICDQTIEIADIGSKTFGDDPFTLAAVTSSGLPASFTSSDPKILTITGNIARIKGDGEVTITATQAGNMNYQPVSTTKTIVIQKRIITGITSERPGKLTVYPNPASDYVWLQGFSPNEHITLHLYRVDGKVADVEEFSGKEDYELDLTSLTPGIYVIAITSASRHESKRIIKK